MSPESRAAVSQTFLTVLSGLSCGKAVFIEIPGLFGK